MKETLNEILDQAHQITKALISSEGEITPEIELLINLQEISLHQKVDAIAYIEAQLESNAALFKAKASQFALIAKGLERSQDYLRNRVKTEMLSRRLKSLEGLDHRITLSEAPSKVAVSPLTEDDRLNAKALGLLRERIIEDPDKDMIKAYLSAGRPLAWAHLEPVHSLRISVNAKPKELL